MVVLLLSLGIGGWEGRWFFLGFFLVISVVELVFDLTTDVLCGIIDNEASIRTVRRVRNPNP